MQNGWPFRLLVRMTLQGEVAEWSNALDLKSSEAQVSEGSNPSLSVPYLGITHGLAQLHHSP
jgi:hypothetical protein